MYISGLILFLWMGFLGGRYYYAVDHFLIDHAVREALGKFGSVSEYECQQRETKVWAKTLVEVVDMCNKRRAGCECPANNKEEENENFSY